LLRVPDVLEKNNEKSRAISHQLKATCENHQGGGIRQEHHCCGLRGVGKIGDFKLSSASAWMSPFQASEPYSFPIRLELGIQPFSSTLIINSWVWSSASSTLRL